jgi:hypothetical protein
MGKIVKTKDRKYTLSVRENCIETYHRMDVLINSNNDIVEIDEIKDIKNLMREIIELIDGIKTLIK